MYNLGVTAKRQNVLFWSIEGCWVDYVNNNSIINVWSTGACAKHTPLMLKIAGAACLKKLDKHTPDNLKVQWMDQGLHKGFNNIYISFFFQQTSQWIDNRNNRIIVHRKLSGTIKSVLGVQLRADHGDGNRLCGSNSWSAWLDKNQISKSITWCSV